MNSCFLRFLWYLCDFRFLSLSFSNCRMLVLDVKFESLFQHVNSLPDHYTIPICHIRETWKKTASFEHHPKLLVLVEVTFSCLTQRVDRWCSRHLVSGLQLSLGTFWFNCDFTHRIRYFFFSVERSLVKFRKCVSRESKG